MPSLMLRACAIAPGLISLLSATCQMSILLSRKKVFYKRRYAYDFTVDEGGSAEPTRDKNIMGMYRRRGSSPSLLCDPG